MNNNQSFNINEGDIVQHNTNGKVISIEKPNTHIRVVYHSDGRVWALDYQKKLK